MDEHGELFGELYLDRVLAHEVLFPHRHPNRTEDFHREMILDWHDSTVPRSIDMVFRGGAKSTIAEEAVLIRAGFREFKNALIIGETEERACERVHAIQREIETNEQVAALFGDLRGPTWADGELVLSNGVRILALGRGQALRGIKYEDMRPDAVFCDDVETLESASDKERRKKTARWFFADLLPACDVNAFVRVAATPLDNDALAVKLLTTGGWRSKVFPIEYIDETGQRAATWPDRFPLGRIDELRDTFTRQGLVTDFEREYMCLTVNEINRTFRPEYMKVVPAVRTWQAVYAMFDPARTVKAKSATTGYASWSWINNRLVVWDSWARHLMPDQIVAEVFHCATSTDLPPVWIGVEEDGLNEFLLQPIRTEQIRRGISIPFRAMRAPKGKIDFIAGLQPYFKAREVQFAKELPDLRDQLLGFPTGLIDAPNALAYALKMKPGKPLYDGFSVASIVEGLRKVPGSRCYLAAQPMRGGIGAALVQWREGSLFVLKDWFREGTSSLLIEQLVSDARVEAGEPVTVVLPPAQFQRFGNAGVAQACRAVPVEVQTGGDEEVGRIGLAELLTRMRNGFPMVRVSSYASWTLNGFVGGYCQYVDKDGALRAVAEPGPYRCVIEALESFVAMAKGGTVDERGDLNYEYTDQGRRYLSARR